MLTIIAGEGFPPPGCPDFEIVAPRGSAPGARRNAGLDKASGAFIAFADAGDEALPGFFETLLSAAREKGADIAAAALPGARVPEGVLSARDAVSKYLRGDLFSPLATGAVFKRELFRGIRFPESGEFCDLAVCYKLCAAAGRVAVVGGPGCSRGAAEPDESGLTADIIVEHLAIYREREEFISARFPDLRALARYSEWSYMLRTVESITRHGLARCYAPLRYMRNELKTYRREFSESPFTTEREKALMRMYI
jgi:glycosyltransferase involved in cell wall biosynthesis